MPKEKYVQIFLLRRIPGGKQRLFYTIGMAMAQQDPLPLQIRQPLRRLMRAKVAIAGHLFKGNLRKTVMEPLAISPAVPQMENHTGSFPLYRPDHIGDIPVGVGKDQDLHETPSFSIGPVSIPLFFPFCNRFDSAARVL